MFWVSGISKVTLPVFILHGPKSANDLIPFGLIFPLNGTVFDCVGHVFVSLVTIICFWVPS